MSRFKRQVKLWSKFIANGNLSQVSFNRVLIKVFKGFWFLITWPLEVLGDLFIWPTKFTKLNQQPRILIVKIDQLGDVLFSTFLVPIIKQAYPGSQIDYLINPRSEAILKNNPDINQIFYWQDLLLQNIPGRQKNNFGQKIKGLLVSWRFNLDSWWLLKQQDYDLVINCRAFWPSSNWFWSGLGQQLIAFDFSQMSCAANYQADYDFKVEEWQNYLTLLEPLEIDTEILKLAEPRGRYYNFSPAAIQPSEEYWCLAAVSFDNEKTWNKEQWRSFITEFLVKTKAKLVLTGLPNQAVWLQDLIKPFGNLSRLIIATDLTIPELAELIKNSQGFIGLESFAAHLAIACYRPTYCLVNSRLFYVTGLSQGNFIDGRSMLPQLPEVIIRDLLTTNSGQLIRDIFTK